LPFDDEGELTQETIAGIREAEASLARGQYVTHEEMMREFGS
jgi:predicted transcriptional regulator